MINNNINNLNKVHLLRIHFTLKFELFIFGTSKFSEWIRIKHV